MSVVITQVKSANGSTARQRDTLRSLGLRGIGKSVERTDSPQLRGMVHAVRHLVTVQETRPSPQGAVASAAEDGRGDERSEADGRGDERSEADGRGDERSEAEEAG